MRFTLHSSNAARSLRADGRTFSHQLITSTLSATLLWLFACPTRHALADVAVSVNSQGTADAFVSVSQSIGWRFNVNAPIQITALGLLDKNNDGFQTDHPLGLWNSQGTLLAGAMVHAGTIEPLLNRFRYASLAPQDQVILTPGQDYTIGFFTTPAAPNDGFVVFNGTHTMNPMINQVGAQFYTIGSPLLMPNSPNPLGSQCFGPGFQFNVVPSPATLSLLGLFGFRARRRR